MASYTPPVAHATGDDFSVSDYTALAGNTTFLYQKPYITTGNSSLSLTTSTATQVTLGFATTLGYGFSISSNNIILPLTGTYNFSWNVTLSSGAGSGLLQSSIRQNGTAEITGSAVWSGSANPASSGSGLIIGTAGDTIGLWAFQSSGDTLTGLGGQPYTYLQGFFVGSQ